MTCEGIKLLRNLSSTKPALQDATDKPKTKLAVILNLNHVLNNDALSYAGGSCPAASQAHSSAFAGLY